MRMTTVMTITTITINRRAFNEIQTSLMHMCLSVRHFPYLLQ